MGYKVEEEPKIDIWPVTVDGLIRKPKTLTHEEITSKPKHEIKADIICLQGKNLTGTWEGASLSDLILDAEPLEQARFLAVTSYGGFTETVELKKADNIFLAYNYEGKPIDKDHGGPYRLLAPDKYAYKSVKWVKELRFVAEPVHGYWEEKGYPEEDCQE
jgi:DMSO/TMAO reductase YedYZ molybdopterin-dependent catalytic subunit